MGRNAPGSPWRSTPNAKRNRKRVELTLPAETLAKLAILAGPSGSLSAAAEKAIDEAFARSGD